MTEHLPECPDEVCICSYLRACTKRVLDGASEQDYANGKSHGLLDGYEDGYQEGYAEALDAAREAVDFVTVFIADVGEKGKPDLRQMIHVGSALTAIDALKEKP